MDFRRRFIFRGNAAAIGGRIVFPADVVIDSGTASSLTVCGGRSRAKAGATKFGDWVRFGTAATSAEGLFDDVAQQHAVTQGKVAEDTLTMSTTVFADVTSLSVGDSPKLTIKRLHASLIGKSPAASGEPSLVPGNDTAIDGVSIGRFGLIVTLDLTLFQKYDTRSKLLTAADDPAFVKKSGKSLFMNVSTPGSPSASAARLPSAGSPIYATIVKSIKWERDPYPGATIEQHVVTVPEFGKIFFGELLITDVSRRLTMLRLELGSPIRGFVASCEVESNGGWSN